MSNNNPKVIIPTNLDNAPEPHEIETAWILAEYFNCDVEYIRPVIGFNIKTADFVINGQTWECKSPIGNSKKHTIKDQFSKAKGKSKYLVIDGSRTSLPDDFIENKMRFELRQHRSIKRLLFITKNKKVLEIK